MLPRIFHQCVKIRLLQHAKLGHYQNHHGVKRGSTTN